MLPHQGLVQKRVLLCYTRTNLSIYPTRVRRKNRSLVVVRRRYQKDPFLEGNPTRVWR